MTFDEFVIMDNRLNKIDSLPPLYKAVHSGNAYGIDTDGNILFGMTLKKVFDEINEYCVLEEEINSIGAEADIRFPEDGIDIGAIYEAIFVPTTRDWETGYIDNGYIQIIKVMN